jgi:hypothetical protein
MIRMLVFRVATVSVLLALAAWIGGQAGAVAFDPEGVYIDPDGVLRTRTIADADELKKLIAASLRAEAGENEAEELVYVSLPGTFARVRALHEADEPLPDELKYLKGLVRVRYVFVRPLTDDLLIAGPAEPIRKDVAGRVVGARTGRPIVQLDDLVAALRTCGPGNRDKSFGCTIELTRAAAQRMLETMHKHKATLARGKGFDAVAAKMAEAGGAQKVAFFQQKRDTRMAMVTVEADYMLKRLALGLDRYPVPGLRSYLDTLSKPAPLSNRFWFEVDYEPLLVSPGGNRFAIRGQSVRISTRPKPLRGENAPPDPTAQRYADQVNKHYPTLAKYIPVFADLANIADLGLVAALIDRDRLHRRIGWDMQWVLDPESYPLAKVQTPRSAAALANVSRGGRMVLFAAGGVLLDYNQALADRQEDRAGRLEALGPDDQD